MTEVAEGEEQAEEGGLSETGQLSADAIASKCVGGCCTPDKEPWEAEEEETACLTEGGVRVD